MCGRSFSQARKCLKCGDDLPWLVYAGEISFAKRRAMTTGTYKLWREDRHSEKILVQQLVDAKKGLLEWLQ